MDNDRDLEEIRRRKLEEMQASGGAQSQSQEADRQKQEAERAMRLQILRQILDPVARERLANIRLVKPELAENVENQLVQLYSMGRIRKVINDDELKQILVKLTETKRETKIERR